MLRQLSFRSIENLMYGGRSTSTHPPITQECVFCSHFSQVDYSLEKSDLIDNQGLKEAVIIHLAGGPSDPPLTLDQHAWAQDHVERCGYCYARLTDLTTGH